MLPLILASTSIYRRQLLDRLQLPYEAVSPDCDEEALKAELSLPPDQLALTLARAKAESLRGRYPERVIVGADQLAELDGEALGKPGTRDNALSQLQRMQGRTHRLLTAMVVLAPGDQRVEHLDVHRLEMAPHDQAALARYVDRDRPLDCAGSYKIEALGIGLFARIDGEDFSAITGLPLLALCRILRSFGVNVP